MKKILTLALAVLMVMSLAVPAFAADVTNAGGADGSDVVVNVTDSADVYYVTVSWDSMEFEYVYATWNPEKHEYTNQGWKVDATTYAESVSSTITVDNHSNVPVTVTTTQDDQDANDNVSVTLENATFGLPACPETPAGGTKTTAPTNTVKVTVSGKPAHDFGQDQTVDKLTVTITAG